jgi:hypothetical protein
VIEVPGATPTLPLLIVEGSPSKVAVDAARTAKLDAASSQLPKSMAIVLKSVRKKLACFCTKEYPFVPLINTKNDASASIIVNKLNTKTMKADWGKCIRGDSDAKFWTGFQSSIS